MRRHLSDFLSNPSRARSRRSSRIASAENIAAAVAQVDASERDDRHVLIGKLKDLIETENLDEDDAAHKIALEEIVSGLERRNFSIKARSSAAPSVKSRKKGSDEDEQHDPDADKKWS